MTTKRIGLVTGANKGIGIEIARQLGHAGVTVLVGSRDVKRGTKAVETLVSEGLDASLLQLDVTNEDSIKKAAETIQSKYGRLDILVNNVGMWNVAEDGPPSTTKPAIIRETMETNFVAMVSVTQELLPLLRKSDAGRIVNLSSTLGSLDANGDPNNPYYSSRLLAYNASKAAVNMFTVQLAEELKATPIAVNSVSPGFVKTDLTGGHGFKEPAEGARAPVYYALMGADAVTGRFVDDDGQIAW